MNVPARFIVRFGFEFFPVQKQYKAKRSLALNNAITLLTRGVL